MLRILCLVICMMSGSVFAQQPSDLYHTEVQLTESDKAEGLAKKEGLINVLIKVSGQKEIAQNEVIKKALVRSDRYVTQVSFVEYDNASRAIKLGYNSKMVLSLLTQAEQSIWETPRKPVLVWVVNEHNYQKSIIWEQSNNSLIGRIKGAANERGLPVMFPVGDFDDVTSIEITDLWGNFKKPIADASERYNPQAVLVVKVRGNSSTWTLFDTMPQYLVNAAKKPVEGRASGAFQLTTMVNDVSDYFAANYTKHLGVVASQSEVVSINGIHTTRDFFKIEKQLKQMNSVANVQVNTIQGDKVTYTLSLLGSYQQFNDELLSKNSRITLTLQAMETEELLQPESTESNVFLQSKATETSTVEDTTIMTDLDKVAEESLPLVHKYQFNSNN